ADDVGDAQEGRASNADRAHQRSVGIGRRGPNACDGGHEPSGGTMIATTDVYHSPWLCTYDPRIQTSAVRRSFHCGTIGRRLSYVESRVTAVHVHLPRAAWRFPRNSS